MHRKPKAAEAAVDKKPSSLVRERSCVLRFVGIGEGKSREDIRDELQEFGSVAYVDFEQGLTEVGRGHDKKGCGHHTPDHTP